jgi:type I restriction enzyme S subunit
VFDGQVENCLHQNHVFKARPASDTVSPYLVSMYLNELGRRFFIDEGKQTTNLASISLTKVSRAPLPVPPKAEAGAILAILAGQSATGLESEVEAMADDATVLRQSILAAAFRGELVR